MKKLQLKVNSKYLSIQEGFEWKDIPNFSIITGVNGIGKTQLLQILKAERFKDFSIYDEEGNISRFFLASSHRQNLSIDGLIEYRKQEMDRKAQQKDIQNNINNHRQWLKNTITQLNNVQDPVEKQRLSNIARNYEQSIKNLANQIESLTIFDYEIELNNLSELLGKNRENITDDEIREYANPYFNTLSEVNDYEAFLKQEEQERNERYIKLAKEGRESEIAEVRNIKHSYERINILFKRYHFDYFEMLDPFPADKSRNGERRFKGKKDEIVEYGALSSGEQMIVKFIIWAMGRDIRGNRINTMLLDEPDAHLHPTMCRMMIDILSEISRDKELGGSGIRIIMTTHSPSTVAFAPEESLFVMEKDVNNNRIIRSATTEEAVNILSDGIFTFEKAIYRFSLAVNTEKSVILFVEGKTDVNHLYKAMEILGMDLDIVIIDMHDAGALCNFIRSTPAKLLNGKKMIALFDCDEEGQKKYNSIPGNETIIPGVKKLTSAQSEERSFAMTLQPPSGLEKYCPIEFLYPYDYLKSNNMLEKRNYNKYKETFKGSSPEEDKDIVTEFEHETSLRPFKVLECKKNEFAERIKMETNKELFLNFEPTLNLIKIIIES